MCSRHFPKRARPTEEEEEEEEEEGKAFCAAAPNKYRCRFRSTCEACFLASQQPCTHFAEMPLRLLLVGNNPSTHVWLHGYNYGNPTNRMWKLLTGSDLARAGSGGGTGGFVGVLPRDTPIEAQNRLPDQHGIGFADIGLVPGNDAAKVPLRPWVPNFYARLRAHVRAVGKEEYKAPLCLAFTGKNQFQSLYPTSSLIKVDFGLLDVDKTPWPPGFPFSPQETKIWILPSSSGRAVMTHEQRSGPYADLAAFLEDDNGAEI